MSELTKGDMLWRFDELVTNAIKFEGQWQKERNEIDKAIRKLIDQKRPSVDMEFLEKIARLIVEGVFAREYTRGNSQTLNILIKAFKDLGYEVKDK